METKIPKTELPEQRKPLGVIKRRELIQKVADKQIGQAIREELTAIINDTVNVDKIESADLISNDVLAAETRGMIRAKRYINGLYQMFVPVRKEEVKKITHK